MRVALTLRDDVAESNVASSGGMLSNQAMIDEFCY